MDRIKDIAFRQSFTFCIFLGVAEHQETDENKGFILDEVPCPEVLVFRILLFRDELDGGKLFFVHVANHGFESAVKTFGFDLAEQFIEMSVEHTLHHAADCRYDLKLCRALIDIRVRASR